MLRVGIVGATGMVGQQFIRLLEKHPWFSIAVLAASSRSAGKTYAEAVQGRWKLPSAIPEAIKTMIVLDADDALALAAQCDFVFCAVDLPKNETIALENKYAVAGLPVFSNNSAQRFIADVPMIIPEVNPEHLALIEVQKKKRGYQRGFIVVKPNCSLQSYVPILKALETYHPLEVFVTTFQAISGAGKLLAEVPDLLDNAIPLAGEESKSENEPLKILGTYGDEHIVDAKIKISAQCQRIPTSDGHLATLSIKFRNKPSVSQAIEALKHFEGEPQKLHLPHAPMPCFTLFSDPDRPQVKLDRNVGNGMGFAVGRIRECPVFDLKMLALTHNTVRGAAGGAVLTAELAYKKGFLND